MSYLFAQISLIFHYHSAPILSCNYIGLALALGVTGPEQTAQTDTAQDHHGPTPNAHFRGFQRGNGLHSKRAPFLWPEDVANIDSQSDIQPRPHCHISPGPSF